MADSERAERILHWIGTAADAETRASAAEAERDALALMLGDCLAALSQVPLAYLPGAVEMMVTSAMEAPIQGAFSREHLAKIALAERTASQALAERARAERDEAVADRERINAKLGEVNAAATRHLAPIETIQAECVAAIAAARAERDEALKAAAILLPFVDMAAGEGLEWSEQEDGSPRMDAADLCIQAAEALGFELGDERYVALLKQGQDAIRSARSAVTETKEGADV